MHLVDDTHHIYSLARSPFSDGDELSLTCQFILLKISELIDRLEVVSHLRYTLVITLSDASANLYSENQIQAADTYTVNLRVSIKHDLVLVVDIVELFLGNVDASFCQKVDLDST